MMLGNRQNSLTILLITALACICTATTRGAGVLYDENFTGLVTDNLNGSTPDVDNSGNFNTTWLAYSGYKQNGLIPSTSVSQGAWLPFIPQSGNTYTLSVSFTGVGPDGTSVNWLAFGFGKSLPTNAESGAGNRFVEAPTLGRAWSLFRANNTGYPGSNTNANQSFNGTTSGTANAINWPSTAPLEGGDVDLQIILDTTQANWSASYFAKRPADVSYVQVGSTGTAVQQDIGMVGFTRNSGTTVSGMITNFTLETSGSVFVAGDVNGDLAVNDLDFNIIRDHLYTSGNRAAGDLTSDGFVDLRDFRIWKTAYGGGSGSGAQFEAQIPEPATLFLTALGVVAVVVPRRRSDTALRKKR